MAARRRASLLTSVLVFAALIGGAAAEDRIELQPRPQVTEAMQLTLGERASATLLLLPGGGGNLSVLRSNFLVRSRNRFAAAGFNVALLDAPSDRSSGMNAYFRASAEHAQDLGAAVRYLKEKAGVPVWLVGTSMGSVSAANAGIRLGPAEVAGVVLSSTVWSGGISLVPLGDLQVPVLLVHNRNDACPSAPFVGAGAGMDLLSHAPAKELIAVASTESRDRPCEGLSPHGYLGVEESVVTAIADWIKSKTPHR